MISRDQLTELGFTPGAIKHRISKGRLHPVRREVYAVGRADLTRRGRWMSAVLSCGPTAVLSHDTAAALWAIRAQRAGAAVHVSVRRDVFRRRPGIVVHRRTDLRRFGLIDPEALRRAVGDHAGLHGVRVLRQVLDRRTFRLTDSELKRRFLGLVRRTGLPPPRTRQRVNGYLVDFFWPELGLVVETDGLRYHRTPAQQANNRARDQAQTVAGLTPLRFTHVQIAYEPERVANLLASVAERLRLSGLGVAA